MGKRVRNVRRDAVSAAAGAQVRRRRRGLGLSLREVARRVGVSATVMSRFETGSDGPGWTPGGETLCKIASALQFDEYELCVAAGQAHPGALAAVRGSAEAARAAVVVWARERVAGGKG